jgi:glutathione synthase/RimK-type ligase-like ATP-grasp enzyme
VSILIIVNDPRDLPLHFEGSDLVTAKSYLTDSQYATLAKARVFNLCRSYRYQSAGYYVSLLAAARGHKPVPSINTIQDMKSQTIVRVASEDLEEVIQSSLAPIQSKEFVLSIYFGRNVAKRYNRLSRYLFDLFETPFLRAFFVLSEKEHKWQLNNISPIAVSDIPDEHRPFVVEVAKEYFQKRRKYSRKKAAARYDLAMLCNPDETEPPSDSRALNRFEKAADSLRFSVERINREDFSRLGEFDALFIRETTSVHHHTYRFARKAEAEGLVVIDDPDSILKCTNKVFLAELLERNRVLTPKTVIVHRDNARQLKNILGFPIILKKPDSSFSQGVIKVDSEQDLKAAAAKMLDRSELIIAQEFLNTPFDWRVGIFDRQPLFVCKYFMAKKHWQIIKRDVNGIKTEDGDSETIPVEHAPSGLIKTALRAANLIGDGFYGVDIKQDGKKYYIIEVNDNPSVDSGVEDAVLKDELYLRIMRVILRRIEQRKEKWY